jgi:hypothetical protein
MQFGNQCPVSSLAHLCAQNALYIYASVLPHGGHVSGVIQAQGDLFGNALRAEKVNQQAVTSDLRRYKTHGVGRLPALPEGSSQRVTRVCVTTCCFPQIHFFAMT